MQMNKILKYLITSIFITTLLVITFFRPLFEVNKATNAVLTITATNEKSDLSWDTEARISQIVVNGQKISPYDITLSDNWKIYDGYLLASYKNEGPSTIKISLNELKTLDIEFVRQVGSGFVNIQIGDVNKTIDLYSTEDWNRYTWHYETKGVFKPFSNINMLIFCFFIVYVSLVIIINTVVKDIKLKGHRRIFAISRCLALIQWLISFYTDKLAFKYYNDSLNLFQNLNRNHKIILYKSIYLILLIISWYYISKLYIGIRDKNNETRSFIKYFLIYWITMIVFLIITWPGVWRWDEFAILENIVNLDLNAWQHYITSLFYIFGFMFIPCPVGLVFTQITIISIIVGYIISKFAKMYSYNKWINLLYIPFFLFPVIDQNLFPLRLSLYSYIELLFFCKIIFLYNDIEQIEGKNILLLACISGLLSVWRSESIFFMIFSPLIFILLFYRKTGLRSKISYAILVIIFTIIFLVPHKYIMKNYGGNSYSITAYIEPLHDLVKCEYIKYPNSDLLRSVDKVIDINKLLKFESGELAFWGGAVRENFNQSDLNELEKDFVKLIIKYPREFLSERTKTFLIASGFVSDRSNQICDSANLFDITSDPKYFSFRENFKLNKPTNKTLRKNTISLMEGRNFEDYSKTTIYYPIIYNLFIPIIALSIGLIVGIFKRRILSICIIIPLLCQFTIVFLAAPGVYFMYYFPLYLIGYFFVTLFILKKISEKKEKM